MTTDTAPETEARQARAPEPEPVRTWVRRTVLTIGALMTIAMLMWTTRAVANLLVERNEKIEATYTGFIERVEVRVDGHVNVVGSRSTGAELNATMMYGVDAAHITHQLANGTLMVEMTCPNGLLTCDQELDLHVPRNISLEVHARRADVRTIGGTVHLKLEEGDSHLFDLTGPLSVDQTMGRVTAVRVGSRLSNFRVDAGVLRVSYASVPDRVDASVGAGSVSVELPTDGVPYNIDAKAGGGDPLVLVPHDPRSPRVVKVRSTIGEAEVRYTF